MPTTATTMTAAPTSMPAVLRQHLTGWAGALPGHERFRVVASTRNGEPGWDGRPQLVTGITDPAGRTVVAVPPAAYADLPARGRGDAASLVAVPDLVGRAGHTVEQVALRWSVSPADLPEAGVWVDGASPRLPAWLRPFGGHALVAFDDRGDYLAGVGVKRHDRFGHEISVGTEPHARGRGLARCLVAQAARHLLAHGRIPTYLHTLDNVASSRVAAAAGFSDLGWRALMLSDEAADLAA